MNRWQHIKPQRYRNNKQAYYLLNYLRYCMPRWLYRLALPRKLEKLERLYAEDLPYIRQRVDYYNRLNCPRKVQESMKPLKGFKLPPKGKVYFFDTYEYIRYFPNRLCAAYLFGDVTTVPDVPSIVKSRPIAGDNANSVLLNLDKIRHFLFLDDPYSFTQKKDLLMWRGDICGKPHRARFLEMYFKHPLCNLGHVNRHGNGYAEWLTPHLPIAEHLKYKFILCIEWNDVASNLKWVMSSNSLAVMPRSNYETWFMEGTLVPDYHYVAIKDDYTDLEEKLHYYMSHPKEAQQIIKHAHEYISQFLDKRREELISLLVLKKYFVQTGQWERGR